MSYNPAQQTPNASAFAPSESLMRDDRRLIVVDDEESVRNLFASFLSESYECASAASAEEALALLAAEPYALVIRDGMMPGRNGVELLREIVARHPDTVVIMCSGVDRTQRVLDAVRLGAYDYLIKPVDLDVLEMTVERALERRALLRAARQYRADIERSNEELRRSKEALEHLQAQIIHSEKMASLGQLAAGVAHELNNPAGFVFGNMELVGEYIQKLERVLNRYDAAVLLPEDAADLEWVKKTTKKKVFF